MLTYTCYFTEYRVHVESGHSPRTSVWLVPHTEYNEGGWALYMEVKLYGRTNITTSYNNYFL